MNKQRFIAKFWQALGTPLALAWGILFACLAGIYIWCSVASMNALGDRVHRVHVDIPHLDASLLQTQGLDTETSTPTTDAAGTSSSDEDFPAPDDQQPGDRATQSSLFMPMVTDNASQKSTPQTEEEAAAASEATSTLTHTPSSTTMTPSLASAGSEPSQSKSAPFLAPAQDTSNAPSPQTAPNPTVDHSLDTKVDQQLLPQWRRNSATEQIPAAGLDLTTQKRLGLIVSGLGLDHELTDLAIQKLPSSVTLAFSPYTRELSTWIDKARAAGHEVLILLPVEPDNFALMDPGPLTVMADSNQGTNTKRVTDVVQLSTKIVGVLANLGQRIAQSETAVEVIFDGLASVGLIMVNAQHPAMPIFLDQARTAKVPFMSCDMAVDLESSPLDAGAAFGLLEGLVNERNQALVTLTLYPQTLTVLIDWLQGLNAKNIIITPVTSHAKS